MAEGRSGQWAPIVAEAVTLAALGLALALVANAFSPRGLSLSRDYFPSTPIRPSPPPAAGDAAPPGAGETPGTTTNQLLARLEAKGLRPIDHADMVGLYEDPRHAQELVVFIDARNARQYQEGHIPGAYPFDHYYPGNDLPVVLPACQQAELIVLYCNGGDCEDSEFAALMLADNGIPRERLALYTGGWTQWSTNGLPVELGVRGSGLRQEDTP